MKPDQTGERLEAGACSDIALAVDAVCRELGYLDAADSRRRVVGDGMVTAWKAGRRLPLQLVNAGFEALSDR